MKNAIILLAVMSAFVAASQARGEDVLFIGNSLSLKITQH
jgi:hypothetical protein